MNIEEIRIPVAESSDADSWIVSRLARPERDANPGLCLVFLHGFASVQEGTKARFFRESAVADGVALCTFDFRGHGASGGSMRDLTITCCLEDVSRVLETLGERGFRRFALIGSSMGGYVALWHAMTQPESTEAVCLIAPAFGMLKGFQVWAGPDRLAQWEREGVLRVENEEAGVDLGWGFLEDLRRYDDDMLAEGFSRPTLILHGCRDKTIPARASVRFASECRAGCVDVHLFGDGDHRLTDRRERMWELMREFLRGRGVLAG